MLWKLELKPGFEIMGNPGNIFTNFEDPKQIYSFKELVKCLATRYIARYGERYVSSWNFESWNEPDHHDFDQLNFTVQGFLNYYDACSEGLREASKSLILGGPAASCRLSSFSKICWALLQHCNNGTNYFDRTRSARLDYISIHHKGNGSSSYILNTELETIAAIRKSYKKLEHIPIFNDEADPMKGWSKAHKWRADATYGAMVAKVIAQHQSLILARKGNTIGYKLLGNDNGFLNYYPHYFTQRTLLARMQINNTQSYHSQFIRKPVYTVMGLLSFLGETQLPTEVFNRQGMPVPNNSRLGVIASVHEPNTVRGQDSWQISILIYNSDDIGTTKGSSTINISISGIPNSINIKDAMWVQYEVSNWRTNPAYVWNNMGQPAFPTVEQFQKIRDQEGPYRWSKPAPFPPSQDAIAAGIAWTIPLPGVVLFHVCARAQLPPAQVTNLVVRNVTRDQVLLFWSDSCVHTRCIETYEVQFAPHGGKTKFRRVNGDDIIFTSYLYVPLEERHDYIGDGEKVRGLYRVRAVDYWKRPGPYSLPAPYG
ncbi:PREDICTED: alpha-L-iduronidase-like isoform X2 [Priapulus caudatus]|nr:PREDICTED: alpha-L-iduronidase-like isoform X2 [Priapulus caudatus]